MDGSTAKLVTSAQRLETSCPPYRIAFPSATYMLFPVGTLRIFPGVARNPAILSPYADEGEAQQ
jgi:hypothetical protein